MATVESSNLELFDSELLKEFPKTNITSIVDYKENIIIGDSSGFIWGYKKENYKLIEYYQKQLKSKIDKLIAIPDLDILYILSGGNFYYYSLPSFVDKSPKESDKESKDLKDIAKVTENKCPKNRNELLLINKKKKILFFYYVIEMQRLLQKEYLDKDKKQLQINLEEIPEKLLWYDNSICYYTKEKLYISKIITDNGITTLVEKKQDLPVENISYIQSSWAVVSCGCVIFHDHDGQALTKNMIIFSPENPLIDLEVFNDLHIVALCQKNIEIYDSNDGQCVQVLNNDVTKDFNRKFLSKGKDRIFAVLSNKKDEKAKDFSCSLWEIRELSFEKQIKISLKSNQIEKAFGILNNKLEYNMEKFKFLESFYCDCAWNNFNKRSKEGYEAAQNYFGLFNFNPFELIYHYIKLLKVRAIHVGFEDINNLDPNINNSQIVSTSENMDENVKAALKMLINVLEAKKEYIFRTSNLNLNKTEKGKLVPISFEAIRNNPLKFESSQNCQINLTDVQPKDIKLFEAIKIINEALVKSMVLLNLDVSLIEHIIEEDQYKTDYSEEFLFKINNFTSNMTIAFIYKKQKKFKEALKILEPYINNTEKEEENKHAVKLLKKILIGFGENHAYNEVYEEGLKILLKQHYMDAFEVLLYNELIPIDNFLEKILNDEPANISKREIFLKLLCDEKKYAHYSNEKYQTLYLELLINKLFSELKKDSIPENKQSEKFPKEYQDLKELFKKYNSYNKTKLYEEVKDTWMYDIELFLLSKLQKIDEALKKLMELVKTNNKEFEDIREFCKVNYNNDMDIFKKYFKTLREKYDDKAYEQMKPLFKKEMLKLIDLFINGELLDAEDVKNKNKLELLNILNPKEILGLIPNDWKLNESLDGKENNKTIFNLMHFYLREYAIINNNYKRLENLAKMDLTYKQKKLYELRDKHVSLDINSCCYLCGKKITNNTQFLVYPNGHIYHIRCSPDLHLEAKTGKNFKNFDY